MQLEDELKQLFDNHKNLSEEELQKLIVLIIKSEKNKLGIQHPIIFSQGFDNSCGGDCKIEYNEELKRDEIHISISYQNLIWNYLNNRNNVNSVSDRSLETLYNLVETICHEMKHAHQLEKMLSKDITHDQALTWLKERLVLSYTDQKVYDSNHDNWSQENDSYNYQFDRALEYIQRYCNFDQISQQQYESLLHLSNSKKNSRIQDPESLYIEVNGQSIKLEEFLNQQMSVVIQKLPEQTITSTILRYEYNADKTKKTYLELMQDKQTMISKLDKNLPNYQQQIKRIEHIYSTIIKNDKNLQTQQQRSQAIPLFKDDTIEKTSQQLYEEAKNNYGKYAKAIEELMRNKSNYSEVEYNQRLTKLMQNRDAAQKQMDRNFPKEQKSDFQVNPKTVQSDLKPKVEQEHFTKPEQTKSNSQEKQELIEKKQEILRKGWKQRLEEMEKRGFEIPNLDTLFQEQQLNEIQHINIEQNIENGRKMM